MTESRAYYRRPRAESGNADARSTRTGPFEPTYDPGFLGFVVDLPEDELDDSVELNGSVVVPYTHFCLALSKSRRLTRWAAWNIDGSSFKRAGRVAFYRDPRLPAQHQVLNRAYSNNELDRGHIARRADLIWGPDDEAVRANNQSFAYPNITPQMENFNQSEKAGVWGELENAVLEDDRLLAPRVSVIAGPIFTPDDPPYRVEDVNIQLPRAFFKTVTYVIDNELRAWTFVLSQSFDGLRRAQPLDQFRIKPSALSEVADRTGLRFGAALMEADMASKQRGIEPFAAEGIDDVSQVPW